MVTLQVKPGGRVRLWRGGEGGGGGRGGGWGGGGGGGGGGPWAGRGGGGGCGTVVDVDGGADGAGQGGDAASDLGRVAAGEVVRAEFPVGDLVVQDEPDGHGHVVHDGDLGLGGVHVAAQPVVAGVEVGALVAHDAEGCDAQDPAHRDVALPAAGFAFDPGRFVVAAGDPEPGREMPGVGEGGHVVAEFGDDDLRADGVDTGDGGQVGDVPALVVGVQQVRDPGVQSADLGGVVVELLQVIGHQVAVVVGEPTGQGLDELRVGGLDVAVGHLGQRPRVADPGGQGLGHRP